MASLVEKTTKASVFVQVATGALGAIGLTYTLPPEHSILGKLLGLEMLVQGIELLFYLSFLSGFHLPELATKRYYDWVISTPIMLFTMAAYFFYKTVQERASSETKKEEITLEDFYVLHRQDLWTIWIANFVMLLFGFLGEIGAIAAFPAFILGTSAFLVSFYTLYTKFAVHSENTRTLFSILFILWSGYGAGFLLPSVAKNIVFNVLDILAKNFFGVFLYTQIQSIVNQKN